jgi:hypothetical protein
MVVKLASIGTNKLGHFEKYADLVLAHSVFDLAIMIIYKLWVYVLIILISSEYIFFLNWIYFIIPLYLLQNVLAMSSI